MNISAQVVLWTHIFIWGDGCKSGVLGRGVGASEQWQGQSGLHVLASTQCCQSFLTVVILVTVKWYHIVVLICVSLMTNEAEHLTSVY